MRCWLWISVPIAISHCRYFWGKGEVDMQVVPRLQYNIIGLFCLFRDFWNNMGTVAAEKKSRGEDVFLNFFERKDF